MSKRLISIAAILILAAGLLLPAADAATPGLAHVRYIFHGLTVFPPNRGSQKGKINMPLYDNYGLHTVHHQKASIGFNQDGTVLHLNQDTTAVLAGPNVTQVRQGEVAEYLAPGTDHRIQTNTATAAAIGTTFDVDATPTGVTFVVLHGALQVTNDGVTVVVTSNHQTVTRSNHAPAPPSPVDAQAVFAWTDGIPTPDLGEDVALDANGGQVLAFSSQREGSGDAGHVTHIADGLLSQGWLSAAGAATGQFVKIGFLGSNFYRISDVVIDPAATYGEPASEDLRDFEIRVSSTDTSDSSFTTIFRGTCKQQAALQRFSLPSPVRARYIELVALSNYGSSRRVAVAEFEAVATASLFAQPYGIATDLSGDVYVADTNANRIEKVSPSGTIVAGYPLGGGTKGGGHGQFLRPEAVAVDGKGNIYVADTGNHRVQELSPTGRFRRQIGSVGLDPGQFFFPKGIVVDGSGTIYVSDSTAGRVEIFSPSGTVLSVWTSLPTVGPLNDPQGLAIAGNGDILIADTGNGRVVRVSPDGKTAVTVARGPGSEPGQFSNPTGVAVDAHGNIYVADSFNARVQKIDPSGHPTVWGKAGSGSGEFLLPTDVAVDAKGHIFVDDSGNSRIQRFDSSGRVSAIWGKYATVPQVLGEPDGVAVDARGNVYIADGANDRIQVRDPRGRVRAVIGHHGFVEAETGAGLGQFWFPHGVAIDRAGAIYVADSSNSRVQMLAPTGPIRAIGDPRKSPRLFTLPLGVATDSARNIYVTDGAANLVRVLSPAGKQLAQWGTTGSGPGQFLMPWGIGVDSHGDVYVADYGNNRVQKLSRDGTVLATWGSADAGALSRFFAPKGLAVDTHDNIYVADSGRGDVQKISSSGQALAVYQLPGPTASVSAVAVDAHGDIYATDDLNARVVKFAPTGEVLAIWS